MSEYTPRINLVSRTGAGVLGGVAGGVVLGLGLWVLDRLQNYGQLVGDTTTSTSWVMVLVVAGACGGLFGALIGRYISGQIAPAIGVGLVWGLVTWLVLAMLLLPLIGDGSPFKIVDAGGIVVLGLYTVVGVVTAVMYAVAGPRRKIYWRQSRNYGMVMAVPGVRRRRKRRDDDD